MKRSAQWVAITCLAICAAAYAGLALTFDVLTRGDSPTFSVLLNAGHRLLFLAMALAYAMLAILAFARPRLAGVSGFAAYFVFVLLLLVLTNDSARNYNRARGLKFGDPGHVFPMQLITKLPDLHIRLLGLSIFAMAGGVVHARRERRALTDDSAVAAYLAAQAR